MEVKRIIAGCSGSMGMILFSHPFDTIRVRFQTQNFSKDLKFNTLKETQKLISKEGFSCLYNGIGTSMIGAVAPFTLMYITNSSLVSIISKKNKINENELPFHLRFICGIGTGSICSLLLSPFGLLIVQRQASKSLSKNTLLNHIKFVLKERGIKGLWKGLTFTLLRDIPGQSIFFTSKHYFHKYLTKNSISDNYASFFSGGIAGCLFWITIFPIDVIKTRVQNEIYPNKFYPLFQSTIKSIQNDGIKSFYRGLTPSLIRAFPSTGIFFGITDFVYRKL